ncbi:MAG: hypothetical protein QM270_08010 [Bacillota bacterium]|nr:hypothetical protein [Bacillota bacterium]
MKRKITTRRSEHQSGRSACFALRPKIAKKNDESETRGCAQQNFAQQTIVTEAEEEVQKNQNKGNE